jgi:hypothetical protein
MGLFGPTTDERLHGAAQVLAPYGFTLDRSRADGIRRYEPFSIFGTPSSYTACVHGRIDDVPIEAYEYDCTSSDSDGNTTYYDQLVVVVPHPNVEGSVAFDVDRRHWSGAAAVLDALLWIPPFTILKAIQLLNRAANPDRTVGHEAFDRLYVVRAESDEAAQRGIPPALRDAVVRLGFFGAMELRPGLIMYSLHGGRLDANSAVSVLGLAPMLLAAFTPQPAHPMR